MVARDLACVGAIDTIFLQRTSGQVWKLPSRKSFWDCLFQRPACKKAAADLILKGSCGLKSRLDFTFISWPPASHISYLVVLTSLAFIEKKSLLRRAARSVKIHVQLSLSWTKAWTFRGRAGFGLPKALLRWNRCTFPQRRQLRPSIFLMQRFCPSGWRKNEATTALHHPTWRRSSVLFHDFRRSSCADAPFARGL